MSTPHQVILLLGLFGVPLALLITGHRLKRGSWRRQHAFWGGVAGHLIALVLATWASLVPPIGWQDHDVVRGALGVWSLVVLPIVGATIGAVRSPREP
jgi:hypothetical protein